MRSNPILGPVMLDLQGTGLSSMERELIDHPAVGGVILFTRNYENPAQVDGLIRSIRALRPTLLIAVDHEGGRVQRFREGFSRLPTADTYACWQHSDPLQATSTAGWLMAAELRSVDVDFSFAPVLDVDCGISQIIGDRSFSRDPLEVGKLASAFFSGMGRAGMAGVGKHFPGHGAVALDSHLALPHDSRTYDEILTKDMLPFKNLIAAGLQGIMPAHVVYSEVDSFPAGFSPRWIQTVLRNTLKFEGAVFSDDLSMAGAGFAGNFVDRAQLALAAGCDMVLVCNQPEAAGQVLESLERLDWKDRQGRLNAMRGRFPIKRDELLADQRWHEAKQLIQRIYHEQRTI